MVDNLVGKSQQDGIPGVYGGNDVNGNGVVGETNGTGFGVFGQSKSGVGVVGKSFVSDAAGVYGGNDSDGSGVTGETNGRGTGVFGQSKTGHGVTGRAWEPARSGVHGFFNDNPGDPPTPTEGFFTTGIRGTVCMQGDPGTDFEQRKKAAGVLGEVGPGAGFGHGVMGFGIKDEGVFGWSERAAGGSFVSQKRGQIQLVPREVSFGTDPQGNPRPKLPKLAKSGEMTMVTKDGKCSLWLCVKSWQAGGGVIPQTEARWAEVKLGAAFNGETS
ncbi:hypothetical protein [Streptomyces phaeochromogenes]|uniref:hypothetical protein n=1 Tax=Streptomyces phaeochromogenes TaxID=1923 RepID=UPI002E0FD847|nr:hypothetical protein OG437_36490 [Streptomyces phaeochromogenes]